MHREPNPPPPVLLRRVRLKDYKSIATCDVELGRLVALVGRNGSGKSNFLDALRFVTDGLTTTLDHALRERGGLAAVRRQGTGRPPSFTIGLELALSAGESASYAFEISSRGSGFVVKREQLRVHGSAGEAFYRIEDGSIARSSLGGSMPQAAHDRLYLVTVSGLPQFRPVYDALVSMGFYNLSPEAMRRPQSPDAGELLHKDGANISSVVARLLHDVPDDVERVERYLGTIVPGIEGFAPVSLGPQETLEFRTALAGSESPSRFYAMNMSDGTLRALGILVAVAQLAERDRMRFVGIEEPETALHPAAAGALMSALREASQRTQIAVTTHSPDLLDDLELDRDTIIVVQCRGGATELAGVDAASREAVKTHLYSPGELLRLDQLQLDDTDAERQRRAEVFPEPVEVRAGEALQSA